MVEPLSIDPARLKEAGAQLLGLVFPQGPAPMSVPGSDAVSAAISATMPGIESLVSEGLPGVKAALTRTATSMGDAADIYQKADTSLGDTLKQFQFSADDLVSGKAAATVGGQLSQMASAASENLPPGLKGVESQISEKVTELSPRVQATVPQLVQLAPQAGQAAQMASPMMSTVMGAAGQGGSSGGAGASSASLVSDTKPDDEGDGEETGDDGAAPGSHGRGHAPAQGRTDTPGGKGTTL